MRRSVMIVLVLTVAVSARAIPATAPTTQPAGMVWIAPREFDMGALAGDESARADELPAHRVRTRGFWIDEAEVTNAQFKAFVDATGHVTTAERKPDWEAMKKQLPPGTPTPPEDVLVPGALVFVMPREGSHGDDSPGWRWTPGANWKHPEGPASSIERRMDHPVVEVSWDDATAYATWAGKRLPTEAQWEAAARAGRDARSLFTWGDEPIDVGKSKANTWQGEFPTRNTGQDGFITTAPVKSFPPNAAGAFDLAGNVWEWTADWYRADTYERDAKAGVADNPTGPRDGFDADEPLVPKRVVRGGSFLCHASYCASYRISARMKSSPDTGLSNTGFRCVKDAE